MHTLFDIAKKINGTLVGDADLVINGVCDIDSGKKDHIACFFKKKFLTKIDQCKASAIIIDQEALVPQNLDKSFIKVKNSSVAFLKLMKLFKLEYKSNNIGIHDTVIIGENCNIDKDVFIGPNVVIGDNVSIGKNVSLVANNFVGNNSVIDSNTYIHPNVSIYHDVFIGKDCLIESGTVVGSNGFGIINHNKKHNQIEHIGKVIIKDDVLIGSNCSIDRGTINDTIIGENTKMDNMVHIGHNVLVGESCLICGQVGIAGSTKIGNFVTIAGKVGIIDHIEIGDNSTILTLSCVFKSIEPNSIYSGNPARKHKRRVKEDIIISKLPELYKKMFLK